MRILLLATLLAVPAAAQAPTVAPSKLGVFAGDWAAGEWKHTEYGATTSSQRCVLRVEDMVLPAGTDLNGCRVTVLENAESRGAFSYACPSGRLGRTDIRRDAQGVYVVAAQGIGADNLPFNMRGEFRRTGACQAVAGTR
jgi:hypothetical protein